MQGLPATNLKHFQKPGLLLEHLLWVIQHLYMDVSVYCPLKSDPWIAFQSVVERLADVQGLIKGDFVLKTPCCNAKPSSQLRHALIDLNRQV